MPEITWSTPLTATDEVATPAASSWPPGHGRVPVVRKSARNGGTNRAGRADPQRRGPCCKLGRHARPRSAGHVVAGRRLRSLHARGAGTGAAAGPISGGAALIDPG